MAASAIEGLQTTASDVALAETTEEDQSVAVWVTLLWFCVFQNTLSTQSCDPADSVCDRWITIEQIQVEDNVYASNEDGFSAETIMVTGTFARAAGIAALRRVGDRFMLVDDEGTEHERDWRPDGVLYSPNYVSDPEETEDGIEMYVDCKGHIEPAMRNRFLAILREELAGLADDINVRSGD